MMEEKKGVEYKQVLDVIKSRRSVRRYLTIPVEWDKISCIVEAGCFAPSSGNIQNSRFIVVTDKDKRCRLAESCLAQDWMATAPVHIVVVADLSLAKQYYGLRGERLYAIQNSAAAVQNMLLAATALNLGACWVGAFGEDMVVSLLKIPDYARPQAIITIGYSDEHPPMPPSYTIEHMTYIEGWGSKLRSGAVFSGYYHLASRGRRLREKLDAVNTDRTKTAINKLKEIARIKKP